MYFALVIGISLCIRHLLDTVGHVLAPLKIVALAVLGIAALLWPAGAPIRRRRLTRACLSPPASLTAIDRVDTLGAGIRKMLVNARARAA